MSCHWSRSLSESPTQTIDSSPCCKTGPSSGPPNENVWLRPCLATMHADKTFPFCFEPKYCGGAQDRTLTYRRHLESLHNKLTPRVAFLRRLAGSGWGENVPNSHLSPSQSNSRLPRSCLVPQCSQYTRLIDFAMNDALWTVTGCLRPPPAYNLPILAGIQPAELRWKGVTLPLACCAMQPGHLQSAITCLKSRPTAQKLRNLFEDNKSAALLADHRWNTE